MSERSSSSEKEIDLAPTNAKLEQNQPPRNGRQLIAQTFDPSPRKAPERDLPGVGCFLEVQKILDSNVEVPILYTIYQPLENWDRFKYTRRGNLHLDITFDKESLRKFIDKHPMGQNLTLRIERHPYGFKSRYRGSPYMRCRSKQCSVDKTRNFKIGDYRIAVDEVTGRLGANQFNDDDPYFSACFFHMQCFEDFADAPDLVIRNIVVLDERKIHSKEPECTRVNKMGVAPATVRAFNKWRQMAIEKRSEDPDWQPTEKETLTVAIWQTSIRRGRKLFRVPRGITKDDIELICSTHRGWGGKRVSGLSVAVMDKMVREGRSGEMVASRNGKTGKKGVKEPEEITKKRLLSESDDEDSEGSPSLPGSAIKSGINVEGSSPEGNSSAYPSETENEVCSKKVDSPPAKRRRRASLTPESPRG